MHITKSAFILIFLLCNFTNLFAIILSTQEEIDNFPSTYPGVTNFQELIWIKGTDITNLDSLKHLEAIDKFLIGPCPRLKQIEGFENLTSVPNGVDIKDNDSLTVINGFDFIENYISRSSVVNNPMLESFSGFNSITGVGDIAILNCIALSSINAYDVLEHVSASLAIQDVPLVNLIGLSKVDSVEQGVFLNLTHLEDFSAFNSLKYIKDGMTIGSNPFIKNLTGLESLVYLGENGLAISDNPLLEHIDALIALTTIEGMLLINDNTNLTNIEGLENLVEAPSRGSIVRNSNLSLCSLENICEFLINDWDADFSENNIGCENLQEVLDGCQPSGLIENELNVPYIFPNPVQHIINFQEDLSPGSQVLIYNQIGNVERTMIVNSNSIDVSGLRAGSYYLKVKSSVQSSVFSFVKI